MNSLKVADKNQNRGTQVRRKPPSGRHATLEGEYHPLKLNLSGQKYLDQALLLQGFLGATRGEVKGVLARTTFRAPCDP